MTLLWHDNDPIGICIFLAPPKTLSLRNRFFGLSGKWDSLRLRSLNQHLITLSRVVIHPSFRGAGVAKHFVRRSCELAPFRWIEALTQMGHINPFFERAGFKRVGVSPAVKRSRRTHSSMYGTRFKDGKEKPFLSQETFRKSQYAQPVYYVFDNRENAEQKEGDQFTSQKNDSKKEDDR